MADVWRRPRQPPLLAAGPSGRVELRHPRDRLAVQDRESRADAGVPVPGHAADGQRHAVLHGRVPPGGRGGGRPDRRAEVDAQPRRGAQRARRRRGTCRTAACMGDGQDERVLYVAGLSAGVLDARTDHRLPTFGRGSIVDLKREMDQEMDRHRRRQPARRPVVAGDTIIIGAARRAARRPGQPEGFVRGYDVRTGRRLWIFKTILPNSTARPPEGLVELQRQRRVWARMSVDEPAGLYQSTADRRLLQQPPPENNLFSETRLRWTSRPDSAAALPTRAPRHLERRPLRARPGRPDGRRPVIKAVAQPTKQSWVYVFDRVTGQPVWRSRSDPSSAATCPASGTRRRSPS